MLVVIHSSPDLLENPAFDLDGVCLILSFLDCVLLLSILENVVFKKNHLPIQVFFDVFVVLDESGICLRTDVLHGSLVIIHHLLKVISEFSVGLVKG